MFECTFCNKKFVKEPAFLKHKCKPMERHEEMSTALGQMAYGLYGTWMRLYKRNVPRIESFMVSRYYGAFIKFAQYVKDMNLPDVESFIRLMIERDLSPHLWTNDKVYVLYLEYLDRRTTPVKQASITISTLIKIADDHQVDVGNVFDVLEPNEVLQMIRERRLSPWILLVSSKFKRMLVNRCSQEQITLFEDLVRPMYWRVKFDNNPEYVSVMKMYVKEMGI